ncbi:hypothetical protein LZU85_19300 [Vibrio sp. IRLE0018]|uniref:hypothetical protein n=1 Tax=Vibrio TaxID=662 RepID=UPI001654D83B|nr:MULTISPECIES: hypothetical protein [Vibrio]MBC8659629.1 hypothetical protein [Vibrio parahaemolyticus]MCF8780964.1 hypothetical protein [Vibrio floridensis]
MYQLKIVVNYIRQVLKIPPLQTGLLGLRQSYECKYRVINVPETPYPRPRGKSSALKLGENCKLSLKNVSLHGFDKGVDMLSSNSVNAKKVEINYCKTGFFVRASEKKVEKNMALDLNNVKFKKGDVGVVAPDTYDIKARNVDFEEVRVGFDIYVSKSQIVEMGLPENTPIELISEAIQIIKSNQEKEAVENLSKSRLFTWLGVASNSVTIATPIVQALFAYATSA